MVWNDPWHRLTNKGTLGFGFLSRWWWDGGPRLLHRGWSNKDMECGKHVFFCRAWGSVIVGIDFTKSHCFAVGTPPIDKKTYCQRWQALHLWTGFPRKHCRSSSHCHFRRRVFSIALVVHKHFSDFSLLELGKMSYLSIFPLRQRFNRLYGCFQK